MPAGLEAFNINTGKKYFIGGESVTEYIGTSYFTYNDGIGGIPVDPALGLRPNAGFFVLTGSIFNGYMAYFKVGTNMIYPNYYNYSWYEHINMETITKTGTSTTSGNGVLHIFRRRSL